MTPINTVRKPFRTSEAGSEQVSCLAHGRSRPVAPGVEMSDLPILCVLPAERAALVPAVVAAGGVPVVDLTSSARVSVPGGAWVRVRTRRSVPGTGPVILAGGHHSQPVKHRDTWLEVTAPGPVPEGFTGIVLRGLEAGGACGVAPGLELLAQVPKEAPVIVDAGLLPVDLPQAGGPWIYLD